jgi:hypothetical protein
MANCQDSPDRILVAFDGGAAFDKDLYSEESSGDATTPLLKRNILMRRSPTKKSRGAATNALMRRSPKKSSKSGKSHKSCKSKKSNCVDLNQVTITEDTVATDQGQCRAKPTTKVTCEEVGHGYFWDEQAGDSVQAVPECNFKTHCVTKRGVERDWVNGHCVLPPSDETACDLTFSYDWYEASGEGVVAAACHHMDRCKIEPEVCAQVVNKIQLDWIVKVGDENYGCHGAEVCNAKPNWHWNNVTWPQLSIANPYYDLAITGFFICQPTTEDECNAQADALTSWTFWSNPIYNDCRINPTERECCLDLPYVPFNDVIDSYWSVNGQCMILEQDKKDEGNGNGGGNGNGNGGQNNGNGGQNNGLGKRDMHWGGPDDFHTSGPYLEFTWASGWGAFAR